jgi:hypothetical protein
MMRQFKIPVTFIGTNCRLLFSISYLYDMKVLLFEIVDLAVKLEREWASIFWLFIFMLTTLMNNN